MVIKYNGHHWIQEGELKVPYNFLVHVCRVMVQTSAVVFTVQWSRFSLFVFIANWKRIHMRVMERVWLPSPQGKGLDLMWI